MIPGLRCAASGLRSQLAETILPMIDELKKQMGGVLNEVKRTNNRCK